MSLTKIGLDVSDQVSMDGALELAESNSQVRLRNLGYSYASGTANIIMWADYASDYNLTYSEGWTTGWVKGTVSVAGGELDCLNTGKVFYSCNDLTRHSSQTIVIRWTPKWNGNPAALEILYAQLIGASETSNQILLWVSTNGILNFRIYNAASALIMNENCTAASVNVGGTNTWSTTEEVYIAVCMDATGNVCRVYAGRVSVGTANKVMEDTDITGIAAYDGTTTIILGGMATTAYYGNQKYSEFAMFDGPISTAASFAIPAEIASVFYTSVPITAIVTLTEIDLEGVRTIDMSAISINELNDPNDDFEYMFSYHDTAGAAVWRGLAGAIGGDPVDIAGLRTISDPTARYFQLRVYVNSDGLSTAWLGDTGNFLTVGSLAAAEPAGPTLDSVASGDGQFVATITPSATNYGDTTVLYRQWSPAKASAWSTATYSGVAATTGTKTVTGLNNYKWYEVAIYDESGSDIKCAPTQTELVYVTDAASPLTDRLIAVRDRIDSGISEFTKVKIVPELGYISQLKQPYCMITSGGTPRRYENSGWGPHTIQAAVFCEQQRDSYTEETVIGNSTTSSKGLNDYCDEIVALFDDYVPSSNVPGYHFQAVRVSGAQKIERDDGSWLRMQVVDIKIEYEES